jgi:ABC-2 type transport system permease protein
MFALYKKELSYYFNNPVGYIVVVLFAAFANFLYVKDIFVVGSASMRPFFTLIPWLMMVFVPALTMRTLSEEKRTNTIETLLTLPISETQVVLAKLGAVATVVLVGLLLTIGLPISLYAITSVTFGKVYLPEIFVGYIGVFLMSLVFISLSLFFSSLAKSQVVAFMSSLIVLFFLVVLSQDFLASVLPSSILEPLSYFSPVYHLENFVKGLVDIRAVTFFLSFTLLFTFLTIIDLEKRN